LKIKIKAKGHHDNMRVVSLEDDTPIEGVVVAQIIIAPGKPAVAELVVEGVHLDIEAEAHVNAVPDGMEAEVVTVGPLEAKSPDMTDEDKAEED